MSRRERERGLTKPCSASLCRHLCSYRGDETGSEQVSPVASRLEREELTVICLMKTLGEGGRALQRRTRLQATCLTAEHTHTHTPIPILSYCHTLGIQTQTNAPCCLEGHRSVVVRRSIKTCGNTKRILNYKKYLHQGALR